MTKSSYQQSTIIAVHLGDINLTTGCQDKDADMQKDLIDEEKNEVWGNTNDDQARSEEPAIGQMEADTLETVAPVVGGQYQTIELETWMNLRQDSRTSRPVETNNMESIKERFEKQCSMQLRIF